MNLKEISHSVKNIDLSKGEHLLKDYSDIVPLKRVPVYIEESSSFNLAQSIAIIAYLDEIYPEQCPSTDMQDREIWHYVGARWVVRMLYSVYADQNNLDT